MKGDTLGSDQVLWMQISKWASNNVLWKIHYKTVYLLRWFCSLQGSVTTMREETPDEVIRLANGVDNVLRLQVTIWLHMNYQQCNKWSKILNHSLIDNLVPRCDWSSSGPPAVAPLASCKVKHTTGNLVWRYWLLQKKLPYWCTVTSILAHRMAKPDAVVVRKITWPLTLNALHDNGIFTMAHSKMVRLLSAGWVGTVETIVECWVTVVV